MEARDKEGKTALHMAAARPESFVGGMSGVVQYLCEQGTGKEYKEARDNGGRTPLHDAAEKGRLLVVKYLCAQGVAIRTMNKDSKTPLDLAENMGHLEVVRYLAGRTEDTQAQAQVHALQSRLEATKRQYEEERQLQAAEEEAQTQAQNPMQTMQQPMDSADY